MKVLVFCTYLLKDLFHDPGRSLLTIASLTIMVLSYLLTAALADSFQQFGSQPRIASQNLALLASDTLDPMQGSVSKEALDRSVQAIQETFGAQSVRHAVPVILRTLLIGEWSMEIIAVSPTGMTEVYDLDLLDGHLPSGNTELAASEETLKLTGWQVGQAIQVYGQQFEIVGCIRYAAGKMASLWMTYAAGEALFSDRRGFQLGAINLAAGLDPEQVRTFLETVEGILPEYAVYLEQQVHERYVQLVQDILKLTIVFEVMALSIITFGIFNATHLTLAERSHEIALLRVAGFTPGAVRRILFGRAMLLTLAAYLIGWALAALVALRSIPKSFALHSSVFTLRLSATDLLVGLVLTILFAWLGVWLTASSQSRQSLALQLSE
jgi:hypothetical protein